MGVELDLSELAVLRPIQTAASSGGGAAATPRRGSDDGPDADDTGCVTPTAKSSLLPRSQGGLGIDAAALVDSVVDTFTTPTSSACLLRPATVCPPAPRKPARAPSAAAAAKRKRCCDSPELRRCFFPVPQDLSTVFLPRGPVDRSTAAVAVPPPPPAKKIRRLFVVG